MSLYSVNPYPLFLNKESSVGLGAQVMSGAKLMTRAMSWSMVLLQLGSGLISMAHVITGVIGSMHVGIQG